MDGRRSLAWWQVNPHFNQLWATTCPHETSWRPGEGRSSGWVINPRLRAPKTGVGGVSDTVHVPFYPRDTVRAVCGGAVNGRVVLPDTVGWRGVHGELMVAGDSLVTGEDSRDRYMRHLLQTEQFPYLRFSIDSLVDVSRRGDTTSGRAMGVFFVRGVNEPLSAVIRSWPEPSGTRVLARMRIPATVLWDTFGISKTVLMGVGTGIWKDFYMGVDLVMRPEKPRANP